MILLAQNRRLRAGARLLSHLLQLRRRRTECRSRNSPSCPRRRRRPEIRSCRDRSPPARRPRWSRWARPRRPSLPAPPVRTTPARWAAASRRRRRASRECGPACRGNRPCCECLCCTASHSARERSGPSPIISSRAGTFCCTRSKISITSGMRFTGRKFDRCTRIFSSALAYSERRCDDFRRALVEIAVDEVGNHLDRRLHVEDFERPLLQIIGDRGDAVALVDGEARDRQIRRIGADQRDVGAVQRGDVGQPAADCARDRSRASAAPASRSPNAGWRSARAAGRARRSRRPRPCAWPAPGRRADIRTADNARLRLRDSECWAAARSAGWAASRR